jgi:hypothetical protein
MNEPFAARTERIADLIRLSVGVRAAHGAMAWRCRHLPLYRLRTDSEHVHRLLSSLCSDMWGDAANHEMVEVAHDAIDARLAQVEVALPEYESRLSA